MFMARGYEATSIREISRDVGVTEAALYYHFEGKRDLLREVIRTHLPDLTEALDYCQGAESLGDLVERFGQSLGDPNPARMERFRWVTTEFPRLSEEERAILHEKHLSLHRGLASIVRRFTEDDRESEILSWTIISAALRLRPRVLEPRPALCLRLRRHRPLRNARRSPLRQRTFEGSPEGGVILFFY